MECKQEFKNVTKLLTEPGSGTLAGSFSILGS